MRTITLAAIAGLLLAPPVLAQQDAADLVAKKEAKLAKPFVKFGGWIADYDAARAKAKEEGKVLFVYFTRSYAP